MQIVRQTVPILLICLLCAPLAWAQQGKKSKGPEFPNSPDGYASYKFGDTVEKVIDGSPNLKKKYKPAVIRKRCKKGGFIWVTDMTRHLGYRGNVNYYFDDKGEFFKAVVTVESDDMDDFDGFSKLVTKFKATHGEPTMTVGKTLKWIGGYSVVFLKELVAVQGFRAEITYGHTATLQDFDEVHRGPEKL